jgi:hypothetical protein
VPAYSFSQAAGLMPEAATHVQDVIPLLDRAGIEHLPLDLLEQRISVHPVQPAEGHLGIARLTPRLKTLMQAARDRTSPSKNSCLTKRYN